MHHLHQCTGSEDDVIPYMTASFETPASSPSSPPVLVLVTALRLAIPRHKPSNMFTFNSTNRTNRSMFLRSNPAHIIPIPEFRPLGYIPALRTNKTNPLRSIDTCE